MRVYSRAIGASFGGIQQIVIFAFLTAVFFVLLSKSLGNGVLTISWQPAVVPVRTFINSSVKVTLGVCQS